MLKTNLNDIWRTCNKIRSAIARIELNLWKYFQPLDTHRNNLISETKFIQVLLQLRGKIGGGLSEQEITELTDYFKIQDGRIAYNEFCNVIHLNSPEHQKNPDLIDGLEWEDPLHKNRLAKHEHRRLCILLTKIAQSVRLRDIVMRPYFQDYELISKNCGTVTLAHFARVLHFLGIKLSSDDYHLLVKRYLKDSYTLNYIGFIEDIECIVKYLDTHRMLDHSNDIIENFPGRLIDCELPKLPRPEIGRVHISEVFGKESAFHPVLRKQRQTKEIDEVNKIFPRILLRIQRYIYENGIRVHEFFQDFDQLRSGTITKSQFLRGLDRLGISGLNRLYFSECELETLTNVYENEVDINLVNWKLFEDNVDKVFTEKCLDKKPFQIVPAIPPPIEITEMKRDGQADWQQQTDDIRSLCEESLLKIKARISKRRVNLEPFFRDLDKLNTSHVSRSQMRRVILTNAILLSDEELYALKKRYNDDIGFNYVWFLNEADPKDFGIPKVKDDFSEEYDPNSPSNIETQHHNVMCDEEDIIQVLAKIKGMVVRNRLRIIDFMTGFDPLSHQMITIVEFQRSLDSAGIRLSTKEFNTIVNVFKSPLRSNNYIDYRRFCKCIDEVFYQTCLERAPLLIPLQHCPSDDNRKNFLNFMERKIVSNVLRQLSKHPDQISNLISIFQDYDKTNCGTLTESQFLRALTVRELNNLFSNREFQVLCKCFGRERGLRMEIDYRAFLQCLDILYATKYNFPF